MTYQRNDTPEPLATREELVIMFELVKDEHYAGVGFVMKREEGKTPNGNNIARRWVLRNEEGEYLDMDVYRSDLAERFNLRLATP